MKEQKNPPHTLVNKVEWIDHLKACAVLMVLFFHLFHGVSQFDISVIKIRIESFQYSANCSWGDCGVAIFFFISGASLMFGYSKSCDIRRFYLKRIKRIYPMFFIAWLFSFLTRFYIDRAVPELPAVRLIYTFLGADGYLSQWISTFYLVGEWFLGMIIMIYAVFPLLRICIKKNCICTLVILYAVSVIFIKLNLMACPVNRIPFVCLFTTALGMTFIEKKLQIHTGGFIISVICTCIFIFIPLPDWLPMRFNYLAYSITLCIIGLHGIISTMPCWINFGVNKLCKYSYPIFLVHHRLLFNLAEYFQEKAFRLLELFSFIIIYLIILYCLCLFLSKLSNRLINTLTKNHPPDAL